MNRFALLLVLASICACSPQQNVGETGTTTRIVNENAGLRIDSVLKAFVDEGRVAGVSALIYEKDEEVYYNAFGYADREKGVAMDRNTIVRIYSMTKPITGVALMKLYEEGAFQLDDPLEKYAPEFANMSVCTGVDESGQLILEPPKRLVTIRDITRHTAGFVNNQPIPALQEMTGKAQLLHPESNLSEMARKLGRIPLMFHPGEQWSYGFCVDVQAFLVERLSGKPFDQYMKENILDPLGMNDTHYVVPELNRDRFATAYQRKEGVLTPITGENINAFNLRDTPMKPGGFGLTSTLDDYMRFATMLVNEGKLGDVKILDESTVRLMATDHLPAEIQERAWLPSKGRVGFGIDFAVRTDPPANREENRGVVGEFFWDGAASTLFWVDPVNELTAVFFVQVMPFDREIHKRFRDAVYGESALQL